MQQFSEMMAEILETTDLPADKKLVDFEGWDSLTALSIIASADTEFGVQITYKDITEAGTIGGLKKKIDEERIQSGR